VLTFFSISTANAGELTAKWKDGLSLSDGEGTTLKFGGRIFNDWAFFYEDDDFRASDGPIADGTEFRTARLFASGTIGGVVEYKSQIDFAKDTNELKDMYLGLVRIPGTQVGVRVGRFKQPFSLEELDSGRYITFMERSVTASFAPSRQSGLMLHGGFQDDRGTLAASVYRETSSHGKQQADGQYSFAGRLTFLPWIDEDRNALLHVGAAVTQRNDGDSVEFGLEPEAHLQPDYTNVDGDGLQLAADSWTLVGLESAVVVGRYSAQAEYLLINTAGAGGAEDGSFSSYYVQGSVFLTGESRPYKKSASTFSRVKPKDPMTADGGHGALELAVRLSNADLNDGDYVGGTLDAVTLGANWYIQNNTRVMLNWVRTDGEVEGGSKGVTQAIQARFQVDF
jgi:phosphate-selective porin OprO/OprP